ncbi:MAG: molybdopterin-containing oxidoreductase family protein [Acidimicrobiia bacterium]
MSGPIVSADGLRQVHTFCRVCNAMCGIVVDVEGDRVLRVSGDPDHPVSAGYTCSKGRALPELHHDPERLDTPLVRDAAGVMREMGPGAALDDLAGRLSDLAARHGPGVIGAYRATHWAFDCNGRALAERFFRALPTPQLYSAVTVDAPNKTLVPDLITGAPFIFPQVDWDSTRFLLLVGQNPVVSHGHTVARPDPVVALRRIRERGGTVVVADPRTTETARLADVHLALRPGSDAALLAFLVGHALARRPDGDYLAGCAEVASVDGLRRAVAPWTLAAAASRCGVDPAELERVAALVESVPRLSVQTGTGVSMGSAPNVTEWLAWALGAVSGSLDRAGGMVFNPGVLRPQETRLVTRPRVSGPPPASRPELTHAYGELPCTALIDEIESGALRALFVLGGNPVTTLPDSGRLEAALASLDVLVVCDIRPTETTRLANYVLPVADQLERHDITSFLDLYFPFPFVQYGPPVVQPPPGRRPMWEVFAGLGRRMGLAGFESAEDTDDESLVAAAASRARVPWEAIRGAPSGLAPRDAPGPGWLIPDRLPRGRLDLAPAELVGQLARWGETDAGPGGLVLINRRLPRQSNSVLRHSARQRARAPHPTLLMHPEDATRLGFSAGDQVSVASGHGETAAEVEVTGGIRPGVVSLPHGWDSPGVNRLTSAADGVDPLTGMPRFSGLAVTVSARATPEPVS